MKVFDRFRSQECNAVVTVRSAEIYDFLSVSLKVNDVRWEAITRSAEKRVLGRP